MQGGGRLPRVAGPQVFLWLAWLLAGCVIVYVVGAPFWGAEYPMITEFPFHAAASSVFRHYGEADWHFREQFVFQPLVEPSLSLYGLSALLMLVMPPVAATKLASALLLALLPLGLMVLCWGMRKSPLLGLWGLLPVWGVLTGWGFLNVLAGMGLFAMSVGLALRLVDRRSRELQVALLVCLALMFVTHALRVPLALLAIALAAVLMRERSEGMGPLLLVLLVGAFAFAGWWYFRASSSALQVQWEWPPDWERLSLMEGYLYDVWVDDRDLRVFRRALFFLLLTAAGLWGLRFFRSRTGPRAPVVHGPHAVVGFSIVLFFVLYMTLPMEMGDHWYVFPREITAAAFLLPALLLPNLPNRTWAHLGFVAVAAVALLPLGYQSARASREFSENTVHFRTMVEEIPPAPKLLYLVFEHGGSRSKSSPFVHLPAYVQAERGGWLSFHFAEWERGPLRYRSRADSAAVVPPQTPARWEWSPRLFRLEQQGAFFDWFLVRQKASPDELFAADPAVQRVAHFENWWLYRRLSPSTGPIGKSP